MVAILYPRRLPHLLDVTQPGGTGQPDQGIPVLHSSNSSFVIQTIAAGGGGSFSLGASNLGNTLGQTGVTGSRVVLAGIGNLTLSQLTDANGGTITISGGTVAAGAAFSAGVSGGNTAGQTGATGTRLVLAGGQSITLSQLTDANGGTVTISGASQTPQSVQTQNRFNLTLDGNTAGALAQVSSGTLTLAGGNGITLSQAGNAITISGNTFTQSVQPETQTFIGGVSASDTLYTSGTVRLTGVGGGVTVSSNTGQRVDISVAAPVAQTEQTQSRFNLTISGNTAGAGALISSGVLTLAGGNNITVSQAGNALTISGPNVGGAQTGISGIANSETTYTSGTVSLSALGAITIRSTTGNQFQLSVNSQSVQPETQTFIGGLSASDTLYTSGTVRITGVGGGVTVSSNTGQRIDISVAAQSVQPETQTFVGGISASDTLYTSGTVRFTGVGGGITVSTNTGQRVDLSVAAPVAQTNQAGSLFAVGNTTSSSSGTYDARTLSLRGDGIISIAATNSGFRISATQSVQTQNVVDVTLSGNTAGAMALISSGTMTLAGGNNITVSQAGNAVTISGPNVAGAQTGISGIFASDASYTSGTVEFTGSNMITVRSSAGQRVVIDATQSVQTQSLFSAGVSTGGNTAGDTGITGTRLVFVGSNNITLSQATAAAGGTITISGPTTAAQTNQTLGMYALGNTTGQSSSTTFDARTVSIRGDGIVSVGYSGGSLRISASQSVQPETQTFIGGISASDTLYTSGTVRFTGVGGGITVSTNTGQRIDLSVAAQTAQTGISGLANSQTTYTSGTVSLSELGAITIRSTTGNQYQFSVNSQTVQTQNLHNVTLSGNTAGVMAQISSGTLTLAGGANITLSQAGNAVTISGGGGSASDSDVTAITQTGHGLAVGDWVRMDGTDYVLAQADDETNAEVVGVVSAVGGANDFTLTTGGLVTGLSGLTAGSVYYLDDATAGAITATEPTAEGSISKPVFIARSTTSGYVFNMRGHVIPSGDLTAFLAGMSNIGNTAGDTGITGSRLVLAGGNNITLSQSTNASGGTVTISAFNQSVQPGIAHLVVSNTTFSSGTVSLSGFGDVTVNTAANIIRISAPVQTVESQSIGMSNLGNTSGTTGIASGGQVRFLFAGGNNITLSQSINGASGTITISAPNAIAETQTAISGISASDTLYTSGTVRFTGVGGGVTVSSNTGQRVDISVAAPVAQTVQPGIQHLVVSNTTFSSGTVSLSGFGDVTVNTAANIIRISAPTQTAQTAISGIANSQTTYTSGTVSLSELGAITIRSTTGNQFQLSVNAQTGTQFSAGLSNIGNTAGDTVTNGGRMILAGGNGITLSGSSNGISQTITISGITQSVESQSIGMSNIGNTSGTTGIASGGQVRFVFAGGNNITLSQSLNGASGTITISAPNLGAGAMSAGVSNLGNTAGSTGVTGTRLVLVGTNNISLSQSTDANGGTISINNTVSAFQAGMSTEGNTAGNTGVTGTRLVLVGSGPISLSQTTGAAGGTLSVLGPATSLLSATGMVSISTNGSTISIGVPGVTRSLLPADLLRAEMVVGAQGQGTLHMQPLGVDWPVQFDRMVIPLHFTGATNSTLTVTLSQWVGIYTRNDGTLSLRSSFSASRSIDHSGTANSTLNVGGIKLWSFGMTDTLPPNDYWFAMISRSTTAGANATVSAFMASQPNSNMSGYMGSANAASIQLVLGLGTYSATTSALPASIAFSQLTGSGSNVFRVPIFQLVSGTV